MQVLKRFENELGAVELRKYDDNTFVVDLNVPQVITQFLEYKYRQQAIETYQFNVAWLRINNKAGN